MPPTPSRALYAPIRSTSPPLSDHHDEPDLATSARPYTHRPSKRPTVIILLLLIFASSSVWRWANGPAREAPTTPDHGLPKHIWHNLGPYAPWFAEEAYRAPPEGCEVTQVNLIQRHGARYPTTGLGEEIEAAVAKLKTIQNFTDPRFNFVKNYTYDLGVDDLLPFGAAESFDAGQEFFRRYTSLVSLNNLPFVRASNGTRVIDSATNWTAGFTAASQSRYAPVLSVEISEEPHANNTLQNHMCPLCTKPDAQTDAWLAVFGPSLAARLNAAAPGADLLPADAASLMALCAFDTLVHVRESPFCLLFSDADFEAYEYLGDLGKYYFTGPGQPHGRGRVQGVGYTNELLARLTNTPVRDATQTNRTLDADARTFPLGRALYADFSHDNLIAAVFAAIGLFPGPPLDPTTPAPGRAWVAARLTPFAGRMVTERLSCASGKAAKPYVRILVNDAVQPLGFCGAQADGICTLDAFVASQAYARNNGEGDFGKCGWTP